VKGKGGREGGREGGKRKEEEEETTRKGRRINGSLATREKRVAASSIIEMSARVCFVFPCFF